MSLLAELVAQVQEDMRRPVRAQEAHQGAAETTEGLGEGVLSEALLQASSIPDRSRTSTEYVHVSHLVSGCTRAFVLARLSGTVVTRPNRPSLDLLYSLGHATQAYVTRGLIATLGRGMLVGSWSCRRRCSVGRSEGYYDDEARCPTCGDRIDQYHELTLFDEGRKLVGNLDIGIRAGGLVYPVEVKSTTNDDFATIRRAEYARADDQLQVMLYHHLLMESGYPVADKGIVLYVRRMPSRGDSPYHEKVVVLEEGSWLANAVQSALLRAEEAEETRFGGSLPLRPCTDIGCSAARNCPHVGECFSRRT